MVKTKEEAISLVKQIIDELMHIPEQKCHRLLLEGRYYVKEKDRYEENTRYYTVKRDN